MKPDIPADNPTTENPATDRPVNTLDPSTIRTCRWTLDEDHGHYEGDCGMAFEVNCGTLTENEIFYCPKCGGKIHEAP